MTDSRARYTLLRFTFALSVITYIDRVCIAAAAPAMREDLGLSPVQMGWVFSAFTLAYAAFEVPSGRLGDVQGPRRVLTRIVLWWSAFTMLSGVAWNFVVLLVTRFLFGVGEAGAFPNISRSFARWFPASERGTAHGVVFMASRLGGALTPPLVALIIAQAGWRTSFLVFGLLGVAWAIFWWRWFRDDPLTHPSVNEEEARIIASGTRVQEGAPIAWRDLVSGNLAIICLMYFCYGYGLYFYLTWLPTYFRDARGFTSAQAALLASIVLLTGGAAAMIGGAVSDRLVRRYGLKAGRSIGAVAMPLSGLCMAGAALAPDVMVAAVAMAMAAFCADLCISSSWAMCHDIGGEAAGTVTGCMNTLGNLGGALSPLAVGYSVQWWGSWSTPLLITACVYCAGGFLTFLVNPARRLAGSQGPSSEVPALASPAGGQ